MNVVQRLSSRRALLLGAGILIVGMFAAMWSLSCRCKAPPMEVERWVLQADRDPNCYYGSAWNDGDVMMPVASHDQPVRFVHVYHLEDACTWRGVEVLTPDGHGGYHYRYEDVFVSCEPGESPTAECPLEGHVRVVPVTD